MVTNIINKFLFLKVSNLFSIIEYSTLMYQLNKKICFISFSATILFVLRIQLSDHPIHSKNDRILKSGRILCWIMANPKHEKMWMHLKKLYGHQCDKFIIITSLNKMKEMEGLEIYGVDVAEGRIHLAERAVKGFKYVYENYLMDFEFFMRADEDSFFIMENLRYLLYQYDPSMALWIGEKFYDGNLDLFKVLLIFLRQQY